MLVSLTGTFVGVVVRSLGGVPTAIVGTVIIGLAITIGNVVAPCSWGAGSPAAPPR